MSSQAREAIQFGIPWYFDNVHRDRKRRILVAFLETDVSASVSERCLAVLQACGPGMHKVLQALAELIVHPELAEAVQQLNSHIKPMSPEQSHRLVADAFGGPDVLSRFLPDFDPVAFAGGSAAQVHRANRIDPKTGVKTPVVVKVQREGLAKAFDQDIAIFDQIAQKFPNERQFFASMQADWKSETNMVDEVVNMMVGAELYEDAEYAGVRVARVLGALPEDNPKVVVLERARGVCMDDFLAHLDQADPVAVQTAADLLVQVYSVWLKVVMFGARKFFHGDLHAGNLFFSYDARDPSKSTMTIIDFGMSGVVDEDTFQTMVRLMVGAKSQVLHHMLVALGRGTQTQVSTCRIAPGCGG
ncbi:hypothetical protein PBRA_003596 [Plasmodiophora brassicae]|uniref:Protein kinase domain-containing protein n=1 Tax=Plasmodiophora brassicae TaxID=37360 RepID=A0A0G4IHU4_PLABS|nr:hypothetical protein PBRA_003596 [Plasmodiophora brassicae]